MKIKRMAERSIERGPMLSAGVVALLLLASCSTASAMSGQVQKNRYLDPTGEFSVELPPVVDLNIEDGENPALSLSWVNFVTGKGYWMFPTGAYMLEWHQDWPQETQAVPTIEHFYRNIESLLPEYLMVSMKPRGSFEKVSGRREFIGDYPAYRFVARGELDGLSAVWAGTWISFGDRVAVASMLKRIEDDQLDRPPEDLIPWKSLDGFCASVQRLK